MSGGQQIPDGFEAVYMKWLRMQHRRKKGGPLGDLMVPLCHLFNIGPPDEVTLSNGQVNWRQVQKGHRVRVKMEGGGVAKGEYRDIGANNAVVVRIDGKPWVLEFPPYAVSLDQVLPSDLSLNESQRAAYAAVPELEAKLAAEAAEPEVHFVPAFTVVAEEPEPLPEPEPYVEPRLRDERWYGLEPGARIVVERDGDLPDAKFVKVKDGQIIAVVEGEEDADIFAEEMATIA
jgi:hypothetical protein